MSMDRAALEEELARQLAEVYDDDIEDTIHPELTSTPFHRLDLSALLQDVRSTPLTSQAYQEYAAALVECDANLIASMEATLADVQTCVLPRSCDHPVVVSVERTAMETPELVSKPARDTSESTAATFCVDHCPPCCIGPCKTHCPPDCILFVALSDAKTKADAILAAEEAAFMQLALASVEKIAADVRSQPKRESLNSAAECSAVPAVDPMATSDPGAEQKARERLEQIERSQQALEAQERALAELVAAEERAQRERELARQTKLVADERRRQDEAQRLAAEARKQREIAQQAIDAMEMAAEERQMRAWLRAKEESSVKDARQAMEREEMAMREFERAERRRLEVEASMRRQREVEIRQRQEEREREELARMETVEREQRAIAAAEKERRLQVEKEKQELERRRLAEAKKALEEAQRQERQRQLEQREEAERKAREEQQRLEEEETQRRQECERKAKEQRRLEEEERQRSLEAATRQRQQQHFQAKVLPTMIQRHREKQEQRLALESMAEEEKQSMLVETMLKKEERALTLAKWLRRWKSMVVCSGRQKAMAASCIQHGWRRQKKHVRAAQAVQRRWRAYKVTKALRRRRQDARTAAHVANRQLVASRQIQRAWRRFDRRKRQQLELEDAAAKVQSAYRGFHIRKKLTTALQLAKFVDGDEFEYDEVNLDEFLGGTPEIDDEDDAHDNIEKEDSVDETPILHRHAWFPSMDDDPPPVDHLPAVAIHQTTIQHEAKGSSNQESPEVKTTTTASTASSLYKRMQRAIAHGRRKQKPTSKPKPDVATTVTWSTSGKKAKKVNVPSLVDRLRRTTASSR
ncbi:hypothetical protein AC1031_017606 [Aphanomyces cochlioides]|nr:hypothetical protein AC1031_017606 [Aphanomyces cochlioides]